MKKEFEMMMNVIKSGYQYLFIALMCSPLMCCAYSFEDEAMKSIGIAIGVIFAIPICIGVVFGIICMGIRIIRGFLNI